MTFVNRAAFRRFMDLSDTGIKCSSCLQGASAGAPHATRGTSIHGWVPSGIEPQFRTILTVLLPVASRKAMVYRPASQSSAGRTQGKVTTAL